MDWNKFSDELAEWRQHPVTTVVRQSIRHHLDQAKEAAISAYWAGQAWPEVERLSLIKQQALWEDLFEASAEDFRATMEQMDAD